MKYHNVNHYLDNFKDKLGQLQKLDTLFKSHLDSQLAFHFQVVNWRDQCLVVVTDSAAWATRLRYMTPKLINSLKADLPEINNIRAIVRHQSTLTNEEPFIAREFSDSSADVLTETAKTVSNEALKKALMNLAKNRK